MAVPSGETTIAASLEIIFMDNQMRDLQYNAMGTPVDAAQRDIYRSQYARGS
jgi:hypothetical protein